MNLFSCKSPTSPLRPPGLRVGSEFVFYTLAAGPWSEGPFERLMLICVETNRVKGPQNFDFRAVCQAVQESVAHDVNQDHDQRQPIDPPSSILNPRNRRYEARA